MNFNYINLRIPHDAELEETNPEENGQERRIEYFE